MKGEEVRRRRLVNLARSMGLLGLGAIAFVLYQATPSSEPQSARTTRYHVGSVPGPPTLVDWRGRPLLLARRTRDTVTALNRPNPALLDPASEDSQQPAGARNPYRSIRPALFVALGVGTGSGCPLEPLPASASPGPVPWYGGFRDRCDGSLYDPAGRVYAGSPARYNLTVPPHRFEGEYLILDE